MYVWLFFHNNELHFPMFQWDEYLDLLDFLQKYFCLLVGFFWVKIGINFTQLEDSGISTVTLTITGPCYGGVFGVYSRGLGSPNHQRLEIPWFLFHLWGCHISPIFPCWFICTSKALEIRRMLPCFFSALMYLFERGRWIKHSQVGSGRRSKTLFFRQPGCVSGASSIQSFSWSDGWMMLVFVFWWIHIFVVWLAWCYIKFHEMWYECNVRWPCFESVCHVQMPNVPWVNARSCHRFCVHNGPSCTADRMS